MHTPYLRYVRGIFLGQWKNQARGCHTMHLESFPRGIYGKFDDPNKYLKYLKVGKVEVAIGTGIGTGIGIWIEIGGFTPYYLQHFDRS